jgi:hypothetical protein
MIELGALFGNMFDIDLVTMETSLVVVKILLLFVCELCGGLHSLDFDMRGGAGGGGV